MSNELYMKAGQAIGAYLGDGEMIEIQESTNIHRCAHPSSSRPGARLDITDVQIHVLRNISNGIQVKAGQCSHCGKIYFHSVEKFEKPTS